MPKRLVFQLAGGQIPNADRPIARARYNGFSIAAKRNRIDAELMLEWQANGTAVIDVPKLNCPFLARGSKALAIRAEGELPGRSLTSAGWTDWLSRGRFPNLHRAIVAAGCKQFAVGTECKSTDILAAVLKRAKQRLARRG